MSDPFYRAFEDKFRGARKLILSRLGVYRPFLEPIKQTMEAPLALDLGCGRGEWLELMGNLGLQAEGIDQDAGMLQACTDRQLHVRQGDAIDYLKRQPESSVSVISAFHFVEHIPFELLQLLVREALRVLQPGGLLIMETPNAENIEVGTHTFYYDPTHQRPIPSELLAFLPEYCGFHRTKILRLNESADIPKDHGPQLIDVIAGASPDYAVVAQKAASPQTLRAFDSAFRSSYGLTIRDVANRYDSQQSQKTAHVESLAQQAMISACQTQEQIAQFQAVLAHHQRLVADTEHRIQELHNSTSWRLTAPLRWSTAAARRLLTLISNGLKLLFRPIVLVAAKFILDRPQLRGRLSSALKLAPGIAHRLHLMAIHRGLVDRPLNEVEPLSTMNPQSSETNSPLLSPHASRINEELKRAIAEQATDSDKS